MKIFPLPIAARSAQRHQRGAATLVVVMLLFFVVSLVAAYTSRNLIFEQRTSANQYRSTQSFEAAEAGLEWALAMLNSGRVDDDCLPTLDTSQGNFRERYLITDNTTGIVTRNPAAGPARWAAACSFVGGNWICKCPTVAATALDAGSLAVEGPAFGVRFVSQINKPGLIRVEVNGCADYNFGCITGATGSIAAVNFCQSTVCSLLALHSGAKSPPYAAITARGNIGGASLAATNTSVVVGGVTLHAGGAVTAPATLTSTPGTPPLQSIRAGSTALSGLPVDTSDCLECTFVSVFGLRPQTYREQPSVLEVDCAVACSAVNVNNALTTARSRIVWLRNGGGLTLASATDIIGAPADPVVLVIEGPLTISAGATAAATIHGLVYAGSAGIDSGRVQGALVTAGNVVGNGNALVIYDPAALDRLRLTSGSFVRIPGAWRDFP